MTPDALLAAGFRESPVNLHLDHHERQWWCTSRDATGKRFGVCVRLWRHSRFSPEAEDGWDAEGYFDGADGKAFRVQCSVRDMMPEQVIGWFAGVWVRMECEYNERYEGRQT